MTSADGTTASRAQWPSASSGMNSMNRTSRPVVRANPAKSRISSSFTPLLQHDVHLHRAEPRLLGRVHGLKHPAELALTPDPGETSRLQGVAAHIHTVETGRGESRRDPGERGPVRGERQVVESELAQPPDEVRQPGAHERLTTGQPERGDPQRPGDTCHAHDLVEGEDLRARQERLILVGHAVGATKVAAIGHRDAQVGVNPAEGVDKWSGLRHRARSPGLVRTRPEAHGCAHDSRHAGSSAPTGASPSG